MSHRTSRSRTALAHLQEVGRGDRRPDHRRPRRHQSRHVIVAPLAHWNQRERSQQQIQAELQKQARRISPACDLAQGANSLGIRGGGQGLRFAIVGTELRQALSATALKMLNKLSADCPASAARAPTIDTTQPQLSVRINREAATKLGVAIETITSLINTMIDYQKAADLFIERRDRRDPGQGRRPSDQRSVRPARTCSSRRQTAASSRCRSSRDHQGGRRSRRRSAARTASAAVGITRNLRRRGISATRCTTMRGIAPRRARPGHVDHAARRSQDPGRDDAEHDVRVRHRLPGRVPGARGAVRKRDRARSSSWCTVPFGLAARSSPFC